MNRRRSKMNSSNVSSVNFRNESDPSEEIFLGREILEEKFCLGRNTRQSISSHIVSERRAADFAYAGFAWFER